MLIPERQENNCSQDLRSDIVGVYLGGGKISSGEYKANILFEGVPVAAHVLNSLNNTPEIGRIIALVPNLKFITHYLTDRQKPISFIDAESTFISNIKKAYENIEIGEDVLVSLCDIPLATPKSFSRLVNLARARSSIIGLPIVYKRDMKDISVLHNLHFYSCREGYFQLGNAIFFRQEVKEIIDLNRFERYYSSKSFRQNPAAKLEMILSMTGEEGFFIALRHLVSVNLQHRGLGFLDSIIPAPKISSYQKLISRIFGLPCSLLPGTFVDLVLDFDYPEDVKLFQNNWQSLTDYMRLGIVKSII